MRSISESCSVEVSGRMQENAQSGFSPGTRVTSLSTCCNLCGCEQTDQMENRLSDNIHPMAYYNIIQYVIVHQLNHYPRYVVM